MSGGGDVNAANNTASDRTTVTTRPDPHEGSGRGRGHYAQMAAAQRFASTQTSNFNERLEALHDENTGDHFGLQFGSNERDPCMIKDVNIPLDPFDPKCASRCISIRRRRRPRPMRSPLSDRRMPTKGRAAPLPPARDFAFWTTGYLSFGNADPTLQRSSVDFNTSGVSAGLDYRFSRRFVAGIGVGYGRDTSRIGSNGTRSDADAYNVATYASYRPFGNWFVDGLAGFGALRFQFATLTWSMTRPSSMATATAVRCLPRSPHRMNIVCGR